MFFLLFYSLQLGFVGIDLSTTSQDGLLLLTDIIAAQQFITSQLLDVNLIGTYLVSQSHLLISTRC